MKTILCITFLALISCQVLKNKEKTQEFINCIKNHENISDDLKQLFSEKSEVKLNELLPRITFQDRDVLLKCRNKVFTAGVKDKKLRELLTKIIVKLPKKVITLPKKTIKLPKKIITLPKKIIT